MRSPIGISEGCDSGWVKGELDKALNFCIIAAGELNAEVRGAFEIMNGVSNSVNVPGGHLLSNCEMMLVMVARSGRVWQPVEGTNILLKQFVFPWWEC